MWQCWAIPEAFDRPCTYRPPIGWGIIIFWEKLRNHKRSFRVVKTFKHGDSVVMTIPAPFADALSIGAGDFLQVTLKRDSLIVKKAAALADLE